MVSGPDAPALLARALGRGLILVCEPDPDAELAAALEDRAVVFEPRPPAEDIDALASGALILAGDVTCDRAVLRHVVRPPGFGKRAAAWRELTGADDVTGVAAKFRLSIAKIEEAAQVARVHRDLDAGAREASGARLGSLATRLRPTHTWDDLVVPDRQLDALHSISAYLRHRDQVLGDWGYERRVAKSQGLKILFAGESGTGKTMAAQVLASGLGLDIFQVDLATIVSKYIGDTEKNLARIFEAAEARTRCCSSTRRTRCSASARRSPARTTATPTSRCLPAAEDGGARGRGHPRHQLPPQHRRRVPAPAGLRDRLPVPGARATASGCGAAWSRRRRRWRRTSTSRCSRSASSFRAERSATARSPRRSSPPRNGARSTWRTSCARSASSTRSSAA